MDGTSFGRSWTNWSLTPINPELLNINKKAGSSFFGIDGKYLVEVQTEEIFNLVEFGFSYESLMKMSVEKRRLFFDKLIKRKSPPDENSLR